MQGYRNQMVRVTIESSRYENGQLLVTGTGMAGERFEDLVWYEPHGFHSRPHKGAVGFLSAPGGRREQGMVQAASDPSKVPQLGEGDSVQYDQHGNLHKLTKDGVTIDYQARSVSFQSGDWTITAPTVKIIGNLEVEGDIHATGKIIDAGGNTSNHSH
jgi:phage gp45-like